jgi:hypothetical protein
MTTIFGTSLKIDTRGVVYLCDYDPETKTLIPTEEKLFDSWKDALNYYADTPNPASQIAYGDTYQSLEASLAFLHINMADKQWQEDLAEVL